MESTFSRTRHWLDNFSTPSSTFPGSIGYKLGNYIYVTAGSSDPEGISYSANELGLKYSYQGVIQVAAQTGARIKSVELTFASAENSPSASNNGFNASQSTSGLVLKDNKVTYEGQTFTVDITCIKNTFGSGYLRLTGIKVVYEQIWLYDASKETLTKDGMVLKNVQKSGTNLMIGNNTNNENLVDLDLSCDVFDSKNQQYKIVALGEEENSRDRYIYSFKECENLESIKIPASVENIYEQSFAYDTKLTTVTFEEGSQLKYLGDNVFCNCTNLKDFTIPEGCTYVGLWAFNGCTSMTHIVLPKSLKYIDNYINFNTTANVTCQSLPLTPWAFDYFENSYDFCLTDDSYIATECSGNEQEYFIEDVPSITYTRTMQNQWGTICLPFDIKNGDGYDLYTLSGVSGDALTLTKVTGTLERGYPALIRRNGGVTSVSIQGVKNTSSSVYLRQQTKTSAAVGGLTLTGAYEKTDITSKTGYIIANNSFWKIADIKGKNKVYCSPYHAYLAGTVSNKAKMLTIGFGDDTSTAVETINAITEGTAEYYDLNGRKLNDLQRGVNILKFNNGTTKKVIIK